MDHVFSAKDISASQWIGIFFTGNSEKKFWRIECPCGVFVEYPVNGMPEVDTPHPCGNASHWTVKYENESQPA